MDLSLGLFSSAGVDTGSMLLLKTLSGAVNLDRILSVLDVGCGTGTLGLALAARCPQSRIKMVDRDALAVAFTAHNAALNKLERVSTGTRLMCEGPHEGLYDLVLSNFPAKAGDTVLEDYLEKSMNLIAAEGRCALVIVHTLAGRCRELIESTGGEVILEDASKQHTVFHYRLADTSRSSSEPVESDRLSLIPYIRDHSEFKLKRTRYELDTVWNIGDFDNLSWRIRLMGELLDTEPRKGTMVFWSPGQGHFPISVCSRRGARPESLVLVDRDRLALHISARNLKAAFPEVPLQTVSLADVSLAAEAMEAESADFLLTDLSPIPRSDWVEPLKKSATALIRTGGEWAVIGRSTDVAALLKNSRGWMPLSDKRNKGWRAVILRRNHIVSPTLSH